MRNTYLACYDISNDLRLRRVHKTMRGFDDHLQYSVFECQLPRTNLARCRHLLSEIINHREDQVLFVDLGPVEGRGGPRHQRRRSALQSVRQPLHRRRSRRRGPLPNTPLKNDSSIVDARERRVFRR